MTDGIADQILSADFVAAVIMGMKTWDVKGCAVVVVPMEKGMGPPAGKLFGEREEGKAMTRNTSFPLASCSKHITALALFLALDRLGLSFETKVVDILPEFGLGDAEKGRNVTVADLLGHETGLPPWDGMYAPGLSEGFLAKIKSLPIPPYPSTEPKPFQYNSLLFDVAAMLIARLTNKPIEQFVKEEFFTPLDLKAGYRAEEMEERAVGRWTRIGGAMGQDGADKDDGAHQVSQKVENGVLGGSGGDKGEGGKETSATQVSGTGQSVDKGIPLEYGIEECGAGWGAGRVWMNSDDLIRWLVCAPKMPGFDVISKPRTTDPYEGLFFADEPGRYGLGLRLIKHLGVDMICHNGSGYAHQLTWLPKLKIGFAVLSNSDVGGTFLRSLVSCTIMESAAGLEKKDWFKELDKRYQAQISPQPWMTPLQGGTLSTDIRGTWTNPSFGEWTIASTDIIPARPALGTLPYFPELYGQCRRIFTPIGDKKFAGCFECRVKGLDGTKGTYFGVPFEVMVRDDEVMEVRGLSDAEGEGMDALCPLIFTRED